MDTSVPISDLFSSFEDPSSNVIDLGTDAFSDDAFSDVIKDIENQI